MTDHDNLREAIKYVRALAETKTPTNWPTVNERDQLLKIADAAESTLPKTKMVERWHLEYAFRYSKDDCWNPKVHDYATKTEAAEAVPKNDGRTEYACIRVTGPHQQEVPA